MVRRKTCIEHNPSSPIRMNHSRHIYIFRMGEHVRVLCIFIQSFVLHGTVFRIQLPNILSHITDSWNLVCFCFIFSSSSTTTFGKHVLVTIFLRQLHMVTKFNLKCEKKTHSKCFLLYPLRTSSNASIFERQRHIHELPWLFALSWINPQYLCFAQGASG